MVALRDVPAENDMAPTPMALVPIWAACTSVLCLLLLGVAVSLGWQKRLATRQLHALERHHERLSDQVWELRAAAQDRDRAEAASEAKSRFLATVSHEIRTPLSGMIGLADLLAGTALTREQQSYVAAVKTSGMALTTLIDDILDFARIESGRLDLAPEPFDLTALVEGVVELMAPRAQDRGLEIAAFIESDVPAQVVGDAHRLRQILLNLAGNAVKFTEQGGVGVVVDRTAEGALRFSVSDTGPGIPTERRAAIFEEFEQADGSTTRRHGGTGLGLAIAKRIIARMGGDLGLEDRPGGGSVFSFVVDLPAAPHLSDAPPPLRDHPVGGCRALIVSAEQFQPAYLADMLRESGADAVRAAGSAEAVALMGEARPAFDLLFVDCGLGEDEARAVAQVARLAGISRAVLLFSPFERRAFGQHLSSGFEAWLVKPIRRASLATRLSEQPAAPRQKAQSTGALRRSLSSSPVRVLLAEDNPINAMIARASLERLGAEVVHAADGATALREAEAALTGPGRGFDLVLMDVCMPMLDGLEVTRRIRAAEARRGRAGTRIVATTAHAFHQTKCDCEAAGMDEVLTKPVDPAEYRRLLGDKRVVAAAG